ncbi:hypothetical protein PHYSODRAFT_343193 [Phytophthora sojae]|uniref:PLAC8 family protein n=1 Tax=Phytophthora sojae (strain P6497) TaxID=1094619 RepID=G5AIX6_PHYSP|nr:hypothetical protein PHYSODRAFT_340648 [Phytophthora sojae]XP_009540027.1 hypothetical protein PHYSODRAFT_343193 [Phytophthora sojae]EGZ04531.1 hypothetical protein PHYSODRAFT_343193 [Phytophthora sojae]EGZ07573.1 hypothetical protein PHYSODRAFT_340648 [Phytophthora sojae]|eukprot:XP_009537139.1 hypothetical protein PHYSODRAFT_340648 [Phytophthora sojae]
MEAPYAVPVDDVTKPNASPTEVAVAIPVEDPKPDKDPSGIMLGKWEAQFCGCCTHCVPNCLMATCCPCVSVAQITARLGLTTYTCVLITLVLLFSFTCGIAHAILFVWIWQLRQLTRERFKIPGGCCEDYCASFWFPCCTLAQIATHIKSYKPGTCDFGPQDTLPPYKQA